MDFINQYLVQVLAVLGLALLAIEVLVLGLSTFILFFLGLGLLLTSALMWTGLISVSIVSAALSGAICTLVIGAMLWKPMRNMQNKVETKQASNDLVGLSFTLSEDVDESHHPIYRYSGIDWRLVSDHPIAAGTKVEVTATQVGEFYIQEKEL